jgi:hypothetical protein
MKTQTSLTMLVLLFFICSAAFAQLPDRPSKIRSNEVQTKSNPEQIDLQAGSSGAFDEAALPGSKGSAYLNPSFIESVIILKDGSRIEGKPMRFNLYTQQMQFIEENDTLALGSPEDIDYIRIADKVFVYTNYIQNGEHKAGYFELLEDGECRLLKRWAALYHEVDDEGNAGSEGFYRQCNCYLQFFMNPATSVQKKRKDLAMSFASNGDDVLDYMKDEKLKPKNDEDLAKVVEYYNSLH